MARATIIGLSKLQAKLRRLPESVRKNMRNEMAIQAEHITDMMRRIVPVSVDGSHGNPPGTLRDSIDWTFGRAPKGSSVIAQVKSKIADDLVITIFAGSSEAFYARWQEFGTVNAPAQPYFYVSWRASRRGAKRALRKALTISAREVAAQ